MHISDEAQRLLMKMSYYLAALVEVFFSSCILLIEVFFFYVVIFTFHTCHLFLFPLTILCVTLHFLSQDGFPATVSFLTVKPVQTNKKKREGKKKRHDLMRNRPIRIIAIVLRKVFLPLFFL